MPFCVLSQTTIYGKVSKNNTALSDVFVYIVDSNNTIKNYTKTDANGFFEFKNCKTENNFLQVKSLYYNSFLVKIENQTKFEINLEPKTEILKEVAVKNERIPVKKTGDTIRYKLSAFTNKNDRTLGEALKNIPGLEIDNLGKIKYQGLPISNFFIDGDDILSKKYTVATENITNNIIDEVQILENNQPIKMLQGKVIPKNAALNVTLKDGFRGKWLHNLDLGLGIPNLLNIKYTAIDIQKKFKAINYLKFNNTGNDYFGETQSFSLGGFENLSDINFNTNILNVSNTNDPPITKKRYYNNQNLAISTNFSCKIFKKLDFKSNTQFSNDYLKNEYESQFKIQLPLLNIVFNETNNFNYKYNYFSQNFVIRKNENNFYFENDLNVNGIFSKDYSNIINSANINQNLKGKNLELKNNFSTYFTFKKLIINFKSTLFVATFDQKLNIDSKILKTFINSGIDYLDFNQNVKSNLFFFKNNINFKILKGNNRFNVNLGTLSSFRNNSSILNVQETDFSNFENPNFTNRKESSFFKNYTEVKYEFSNDFWKISGLYNTSIYTYNSIKKNNILAQKIDVDIERKFGFEHKFSVGYTFSDEPNNIANTFENGYLSSYRTFYLNKLDFNQNQINNLTARLVLQKTIKLMFFDISVSKLFVKSNFISSSNYSQNLTQFKFVEMQNSKEYFSIKSTFAKYFFKLKSSIKIGIDCNIGNNFALNNNNLIETKQENEKYFINFRPKISKYLKFNSEYSLNTNKTVFVNNSNENKVVFHKAENKLELFFNDSWSSSINHELVSFKTESTNTNNFLDFYLNYRKTGSKFDYNLAYTNILNKKSYYIENINDVTSSITNFYLRPSNILLTVSFKF